tara:strand:- start:482 stop:1378 length:897 start_codon:yes stop_codon:yes gene_type:complete
MTNFYINEQWKNIAKGHTAFCILGGPSSQELDNIQDIIKNNFTVTINRSIEIFPNVDMYITADNGIAREYFEDKDFFLHKFMGGNLNKNNSNFSYEEKPIWMEGKRNILLKNPNLVKIIACNEFPCYNESFTTGQLYKYKGIEYAKQVKNTHICIEHRNINGESWPTLSPSLPETIKGYGNNPLKLYPGGNVSSILFQLLWYMGFKKLVIIGYGDKGRSVRAEGYENKFNEESFTEFKWSENELHALATHYQKWGDRIKILKGGELCKEYASFPLATQTDLCTFPDDKNQLIEKILKL